ncbi:MAG: Anthranilate phosphoribosyltransferase [Chloroflexi bacterium ADurb.Bin325]|nr:MAG: Anthranilate phosphoribosyltransferase [Chloroflexi bacterium ADurb.Bin325]
MLDNYIGKLLRYQSLSEDEARAAMEIIMTGNATPAQIGGYLVALRMKGETAPEIAGSARAMPMRSKMIRVDAPEGAIDVVGTGGDATGSYNISTTSAFVVAGAGVPVAKHGNRAASSRSGSADVLAALGANLDLTPDQVGQCIETVGIGFLFAPKFHPAMRHAIGPRRELGQRTIFNLLGPLTNPAGATHQIIGVYDPALTEVLAEVLGALGCEAALVLHGYDGLDELSTDGPNRVSHLRHGRVTTFDLDAAEQGLPLRRATKAELRGGDPQENAAILRGILSGADRSPRRDVVLFNAAAALAVECCDLSADPRGVLAETLAQATAALDSGAALAKLDALVALSQDLAAQGAGQVAALAGAPARVEAA